jgi:hypothetical protein
MTSTKSLMNLVEFYQTSQVIMTANRLGLNVSALAIVCVTAIILLPRISQFSCSRICASGAFV